MSPLLPDGATLLRFKVRPFFALEVFRKLGQVGKGHIHPPRSRRVAGTALQVIRCQVNSRVSSEDSPNAVWECFDSWCPVHSGCTSQMHDPPCVTRLIIGKTNDVSGCHPKELVWSEIESRDTFLFRRWQLLVSPVCCLGIFYWLVRICWDFFEKCTFAPPLSAMFSPWSCTPFDTIHHWHCIGIV